MRFAKVIVASLVIPMMILSAWAITAPREAVEPLRSSIMAEPYYSGVELTWDANAANDASVSSAWDPNQVPAYGDNVTFDGTSVHNCNWDLEVTLGDFSMLTGYTGTVTQTADFGCADWTLTQGIFTGSTSFILTCEGNFTRNSGTLTANLLQLTMTGDETTIDVNSGTTAFKTLNIDADITTDAWQTFDFSVATGKTLTTTAGENQLRMYPVSWSYSNLGVIAGSGTLKFHSILHDFSMTFGTINSPCVIAARVDSDEQRVLTLTESVSFGSSLSITSESATYGVDFNNGNDYTLSVIGAMTLGIRCSLTQGTGAWSFGSYVQSGANSVFNQHAEVTIDGDFTVSNGIFQGNHSDLTVSGDWDTLTGTYDHDDNAVFLTGSSKTLDMNAADSFFNVTIASGASYTMDTNTTVDQRATILGTLLGDGDFKEPYPEFTSSGLPTACTGELYEYVVTQTYWDTITICNAPYWMILIDDEILGIPLTNDTGVYEICVNLTWNDMTTWQNYTLIVCSPMIADLDIIILGVVLSLTLGFGLLAIGMTYKIPPLIVFSGLIWLISAVTVYKDISVEWAIIGIGLGVIVLASGGLQLVDEG